MNSGISKIHFTNSTGVSLNERFTAMTKVSAPALVTGLDRPPLARANSITRMDTNRQLVDHWDRSHAMQSAMQLKNTAISRPSRQRLARNNVAQLVKRTMSKIAGGLQRLQRTNSFTDIATMNADRVQLQRARGRTPSITSRLGTLAGNNNNNNGTTRRGRSISRGRSTSRTRSTSRGRQGSLNRTISQMMTNIRSQLERPATRGNLSRAGSRNALNNIGAPRKPIAPNDARIRLNRKTALAATRAAANGAANRSRSRSRSRSRVVAAAVAAAAANSNSTGGRARARKRAGSRARNARSGSVNSRLGTNRTNEPAAPRAVGGRVSKRSSSRRRRGLQGTAAAGARVGRPLKRATPASTRKGAGGKAKVAGGNGTAANGAATAAGRRGRSRSRRANSRVRGRSASKTRATQMKQQPKSREELDSELDQYMASTRSPLDEYINGTSRL